MEFESLVGLNAAGVAGALAEEAAGRKAMGFEVGVQEVRECVCAITVSGGSHRPEDNISVVGWEPVPVHLFSIDWCFALLREGIMKSESGCSDPPRH